MDAILVQNIYKFNGFFTANFYMSPIRTPFYGLRPYVVRTEIWILRAVLHEEGCNF